MADLTLDNALQRILDAVPVVAGTRLADIRRALGHVLAETVVSPFDVPPYDNSAMDGYALRGGDLPPSGEKAFTLVGTVLAGQVFDGEIGVDQCVRIMTGAMVPDGADTVVMREHVRCEENTVFINAKEKPGQHVRPRGEELRNGDTVLAAGTWLSAVEVGLLASMGRTEVRVKPPLRVAFFSTGDELRPLGSTLQAGQIYDSNRYTLHSLLSRLPVEPVDLGWIPDHREEVAAAFQEAAQQADVIITSGGVSVGDADYVKETLEQQGQVDFWKIAMKPGHPLAFGFLDKAVFFGLPGNPVSMAVTFYQLVQPALRHMLGETPPPPLRLRVPCLSALRKKPGRREFQRGILETAADGHLQVRTTGSQNSAMLTSLSHGNCFIILPEDRGGVAVGDTVEVEPFGGVLL